MSGDPAPYQSAEDAQRALCAELTALREHCDALAARVRLPDQRLQRDALSGSLGLDLQRLARSVEAGRTSWTAVFDQTSPDAELAREHLDKMIVAHSAVVREALSSDPTFDPMADEED